MDESCCFFFQAEDGIRDLVRSRGLGDVYKRQGLGSMERLLISSRVAAMARTSARVIRFREKERGRISRVLKFRISAPLRVRYPAVSKRVIGPIPQAPSCRDRANASVPTARALTVPIPVMTTLSVCMLYPPEQTVLPRRRPDAARP